MYTHYRHVLLDLGGVVFQSTGVSNPVIHWDIISGLNNKYGHRLNVGEDLFPSFMMDYNKMTNQQLSGQLFLEEIWNTLDFNRELVDFLNQRFEVHILSDNYRENIEYMTERFSIPSWSKNQFYSFDFKKEKTDPSLFTDVLSKLGLNSDDVFFIDDSPKKISTAADRGISGLLFEGNEKMFQNIG